MMRCPAHWEKWRRVSPHDHKEWGDAGNGYLVLGNDFKIVFSNGGGWEHVSVSAKHRCPTWEEMEFAKRQFWEDTDTVMQLHVPPAEHKNCHPYCLHLWRPVGIEIPRPPSIMVAP